MFKTDLDKQKVKKMKMHLKSSETKICRRFSSLLNISIWIEKKKQKRLKSTIAVKMSTKEPPSPIKVINKQTSQ